MTKNDIKEILKKSASEIKLPDLTNSIINNVNVVTKTTVKAKKRFKLRYLLAPCLAVASVIIIVLSIFLNNKNISTNNEIDLTTSKLVIGREVMLASSILNDEVNQPINLRYTQNDYENDINSIHEYLLTCDLLREDIIVDYKLYLNEDENYPYKYKMLLNYPNFTYTFYYNEVNTEYDFDDLDEVSIDFNGLLLLNETSYSVRGHRENEGNDEFKTETIILQDDMPYLRISQENEEDENEYTYSYYRNGRIIKEVTQSLEFDDGKREMSISIEENNEETEISFTYHNEYIEVEYEIENNEEEFELEDLIIYIFDDHYIYHLDGFTDVKINKF